MSGSIEKRELPFTVGIISDLYGMRNDKVEYKYRQFINISKDNFNEVMEAIAPTINLKVNNFLQVKKDLKLQCNLSFTSINSFLPDSIALQIPECSGLLVDRGILVDLVTKVDQNQKFTEELLALSKSDKLIEIAKATNIGTTTNFIVAEDDELTKKRKIDMILAFDRHVKSQDSKDLYTLIMTTIANIDLQLSNQIDEIIHDPIFQELEAKWRSIFNLVHKSETSEVLRMRLFNASSNELYADLSNASDFDQSHLFRLVYEEEYGTIGGIPFSCLLVDEYFGKSEYDIKYITYLSKIAAAAHTPLIAGVKPQIFDLKSFNDLHIPRDLSQIFNSSESVAWNNFREIDESRYINLCLPRILVRAPYNDNSIKSFNYREAIDGNSNQNFCWGNAAYALLLRINDAVSKYGWAAAIRGTEGGGLVTDLPAYVFRTQFADMMMKCPTQTHITDRREKELSDLGFIPLCHKKMTSQAVFLSGQSVQKPKQFNNEDGTNNAAISTRMPYILNASRFVHYIKVIMRDKIGTFQSAIQLENYLQDWIAQYVLLSDDSDQETKAEYPLREAEILVRNTDNKIGEYDVIMRLKPHFQMEAANVSVRFVGKIIE